MSRMMVMSQMMMMSQMTSDDVTGVKKRGTAIENELLA